MFHYLDPFAKIIKPKSKGNNEYLKSYAKKSEK